MSAGRDGRTRAEIRSDVRRRIEDIAEALYLGDRVELIPVKDGVKILKVRRENIKDTSASHQTG